MPTFTGYNFDGQPEYLMEDGTTKDGYELIDLGYEAPLGDNPKLKNQQVLYVPYSAFDGSSFWIPQSEWGRDFVTLQDALDHGAVQFANDHAAVEQFRAESTGMTYEQIAKLSK